MNWLDQLSKERNNLTYIENRLWTYAKAFKITGNTTMAENMQKLAEEIANVEVSIRDIATRKVDDDFKAAETSYYNTITTALDIIDHKVDEEFTAGLASTLGL